MRVGQTLVHLVWHAACTRGQLDPHLIGDDVGAPVVIPQMGPHGADLLNVC